MENATQPKKVCFPVNENGWILLFQKMGKTILRTTNYKDKGRVNCGTSGHRYFQLECEGGTMIKSKLYDTANFWEK